VIALGGTCGDDRAGALLSPPEDRVVGRDLRATLATALQAGAVSCIEKVRAVAATTVAGTILEPVPLTRRQAQVAVSVKALIERIYVTMLTLSALRAARFSVRTQMIDAAPAPDAKTPPGFTGRLRWARIVVGTGAC
jgi:hypothetical protein